MTRLVRKPNTTVVEAIRWDGTDLAAYHITRLGGRVRPSGISRHLCLWTGVHGAQGWTEVPLGHWVMRGAPNDFYPVEHQYMIDHFDVAEGEDACAFVEGLTVPGQ